jgi:hypothetical protein
MRINHLAVALLILASSILGHAQGLDIEKVDALVTAISHAEGFGIRGTIPSRYHNPGDLKASSDLGTLVGQVRIGKARHIVFKDDEAGKAALRDCILQMMDGRSSHFHADMTLNQVARVYAENWRPWVKIVSTELGVPPTTTLREYLYNDAVRLVARFRPLSAANPMLLPPVIAFPESRNVLDAMLDIPVDVPPLMEEDVPHQHKLRAVSAFLRRR